MHKKYFFFDVDGTLASGLTTIMPESAKRCVARLRENGHFTALATGRLQASAAVVAERYGFTHFVADGGYSLTLDGKVIEMEGLPVADCISFIDRLEAAGAEVFRTDLQGTIVAFTEGSGVTMTALGKGVEAG